MEVVVNLRYQPLRSDFPRYSRHASNVPCALLMHLFELPDDLLLEICRYLNSSSLLALSQSFKSAYLLSLSTPSWWVNDVSSAHLSTIRSLNDYTTLELKETAVRAQQTWNRSRTRGFRSLNKPNRIQAPVQQAHYADVIAGGWLFYIHPPENGFISTLVCHDLRNGETIGLFELHTRTTTFTTKCLAAAEIDHRTVLLAVMTEHQQSWLTPEILVLQVDLRASPEEPARVNAQFSILLQTVIDSPREKQGNESIRLPRWFHIERGLVCWVQDIIDFRPRMTKVTPLVTLLRYQTGEMVDETTHQVVRPSCPAGSDQYTLAATIVADCLLILVNPLKPQLYGIPISAIPDHDPNLEKRHSPPMFRLNLNSGSKQKVSRFEFDIAYTNVPYNEVPTGVQTNNSSRVYQVNLVALANNVAFNDVWKYSIILHTYMMPTSNEIRLSLHMLSRNKGSSYKTYITRFGAFQGQVWCVTMSPMVTLCLEDEQGHWPLVITERGDINLVDLRSGVVCAFSDAELIADPLPHMFVSQF